MSKNDITGDRLVSRVNTKEWDDRYDSIFKRTKEEQLEVDTNRLEDYLNKCKEDNNGN